MSYLLLVEFDGEPDRALAQWGFELVARTPRTPREAELAIEEEMLEPA